MKRTSQAGTHSVRSEQGAELKRLFAKRIRSHQQEQKKAVRDFKAQRNGSLKHLLLSERSEDKHLLADG